MPTLVQNTARPPRRLPRSSLITTVTRLIERFQLAVILAASLGLYVSRLAPSEPFFNNDETRHVMTGVFVYDLVHDFPGIELEEYSVRYYAQYPALGLLTWPPLFYLIEGCVMLVLGTSLVTAKLTVMAMAAMALVYLYLLARDAFGSQVAGLATLLFAGSPSIVIYSTQVMLEVPFLAFALAAIFHITRYLAWERRLHLWLGTAAICAAALTRYDAIVLIPTLGLLLALRRQPGWLLRREVICMVAVAIVVLAPYYVVFAKLVGFVQFDAALVGEANAPQLFSLENLWFYPACLPQQVGWFVVIPALLGIFLEVRAHGFKRSAPFLALIAANYLTFTPLSENSSRHGLAWVPAFASFAAVGVMSLGPVVQRPRLQLATVMVVLLGTLYLALHPAVRFVRGYQAAAQHVIDNSDGTPTCLVDSYLDGNFTYQMRTLDPARKFWVLRGDKIFYSTVSTPCAGYTEWVSNEQEILDVIQHYDPQYIVVEQPRILGAMPLGSALRNVLQSNREQFALEREIPIETNVSQLRTTLLVYRNQIRNPARPQQLEFNMLWPQRTIAVDLPRK